MTTTSTPCAPPAHIPREAKLTLAVVSVAFLAAPESLSDALANFDLAWWLLIGGGLLTSLLSIPLVTRRASAR